MYDNEIEVKLQRGHSFWKVALDPPEGDEPWPEHCGLLRG